MATSLEASLKLRDQFTSVLQQVDKSMQNATKTMQDFKQKVAGPTQAMNQMAQSAAASVNKLNSSIKSGMEKASNVVKSTTERILSNFGNFGNRISGKLNLSGVTNKFTSVFSTIQSKVLKIVTGIGNSINKLTGKSKKIEEFNKQMNQLKNKEAKIKINIDQMEKTKGNINKIDEMVKKLDDRKATIKANTSNVENATAKLASIDKSIEKLNNKKAVLQFKTSKLDDAKAQLGKVRQEIEKLNNQNFSSNFFTKLKSGMSQAVSAVQTGATKIKNFLKQSGNAFKEFGNDAKVGMSKIESAFSPLGTFLKAGAVAGGAALVGLGKKIYDVAGSFDTQMSRVKAISGATGDAFNQLRDQAIDLGAKTAFSATESAAGMENLASAGFNAQEIMAAMPGLLDLAAVSGGDVALASENAATALRGFNLDASQAGHVANVFARAAADTNAEVGDMGEAMKYVAPVANSMGLSIEEVAASIGIMSDAGIKGSQAGTTLRGALARLAKPTKPMLETMNALGLSFYDTNGQMKPLTEQVGMLQNAFKDLTPEQQQNALVSLYGQESLSGMMALVAKGPDALGKLTESLKNSSGAAEEMAGIMQDNLPAKLEQLGGAIESGLINMGDRIFPIIKPMIEDFTSFLEEKLSADSIGKFFDKLEKYGSVLKSAFDDVKGPVSDAIGAIGDSLQKLTGGFGSEKSVDSFKTFVSGVTDGIKKLAAFAEKNADSIAKLISLMPKIIGAFIGFKVGKGILTPFLNFGSGILTLTKGFGKLGGGLGKAIGGLFKKLPGGDKSLPVPGGGDPAKALSPLQTFLGTMNNFAKGATNLALVFGVVKIIEELAQALQDVNNKVPSDLSKLAPKLLNMGIALAGMGAFVKLAEKFSKDTKGAVRGLAVVAGISGNLMIAAVAMQQINNRVPDDIGNFASKMANMGIALGGMGVLVLAAGKLSSMNPTGAIAGLAVVAGISLNLMIAAEAMKQVDEKVPDDIGNFASKVANMAIAIGGMGVLVGAVGALMATGIGAIIGGAGLLAVAALAGEMMLVAEAISQIDAKVPDDFSSVKTKIDSISKTISYFTDANLGGVLDLFSNAVGVLNVSVVTTGINKFAELATALQQFDSIEVSTTAGEKIKQIQKVVESIAKSNLADLISSGFTAIDTSLVIKTLDNLIDIGNSLIRIDQLAFDAASVKTKIKDIQSVIDSLGSGGGFLDKIASIFGGKLDTASFGVAEKAFDQLIDIAHSLVRLQGITLDAGAAKQKVKDINSVIEALGTSGIADYIGTMIKGAQLNEVKASLDAMNNLVAPIVQLATAEFDGLLAIARVNQINNVIKALGTSDIGEYFGSMLKASQLGEVITSVQALIQVRDQLNTFASSALGENVITSITAIKNAIQQLSTITTGEDGGGLQGVASGFSAVTQQISSFNVTAQTMGTGISAVATTFQSSMTMIKTSVENTMTSIPQSTTAGMAGFNSAIATGMSQSAGTARSGSVQIVSAFSGLRGQLQSAGYYAMAGLASGIASGSAGAIAQARAVANQVSSTIRSALKIHSPSRVMMELGGFVGKGLAKGIELTKGLVARASNTLASVSVPQPLGTLEGGTVTSHLQLDDEEVSRLKASANQQVIVKNKQLSPQITINIDNKDGQPIDTEELLQEFEDKLVELIDADLS